MKKIITIFALLAGIDLHAMEMQHGFILKGINDQFASHLVANGHHSWQVEIEGELSIEDKAEATTYFDLKTANHPAVSYFLFQAQNLDLNTLHEDEFLNSADCTFKGEELTGYIVQSPVNDYTPKNVVVKKAKYKICQVRLNLPNPFFADDAH